MKKLFVATALAAASTLASAADIVDTAVSAGQFNTLVKAVQAAGLVETLKGKGPFTVFAPTDEAFAKLPAGTVEALLQDKEKLAKVLTYHVVPGKVTASQVKPGDVKTVQGQALRAQRSAPDLRLAPEVSEFDMFEFGGLGPIIERGPREAQLRLPDVLRVTRGQPVP